MQQLTLNQFPVCAQCEKGTWLPLNTMGHDFKAWGCNYCGAFMTTVIAEKDLHPNLVLIKGEPRETAGARAEKRPSRIA
jgi:hypothetical protein